MAAVYLPKADLIEVLIEQVEYLVGHGRDCKNECAECIRLQKLLALLTQPFESESAAASGTGGQ